MRFGVMILYFDCDQFILKTIENCAQFVEKIYISYSVKPWSRYNPSAQSEFTNKSSFNLLSSSKYFNKIQLINGEWQSEEEQREDCRQKAIFDGLDYLIIQDADEFYLPKDYELNINQIYQNPNHAIYQCPWLTFWKNINYVILNREHLGKKNTIYTTCPLFAINLKFDNPFVNRRLPRTINNYFILDGICFHLSYVLSNEEMYRKIKTWGHSHQVNKIWFKLKWLKWNPESKYLNPFESIQWIKAIPYEGELPSEIKNYNIYHPNNNSLNLLEKSICLFFDSIQFTRYYLKKIKIFLNNK